VMGGDIRGQPARFTRMVVRPRSRRLTLCIGDGATANEGDSRQR
jgi:hypothetical protein